MSIPIIIIGFNNYYYIKKMIEQLHKYNLNNIYVIDNNSSLPSLLDYYKNNNIKVIKMDKNYKSKVLFNPVLKPFYDILPNYFIYTDPDIEFNKELPINFIDRLIELTEKHRIGKVGFALDISDSEKFKPLFKIKKYRKVYIKDWEKRHWEKEIEKNVYRADISTTFSVYNKKYFDFSIERHFLKSLRISGNYTAKHLQWYDNDMNNFESNFYICNSYFEGWNHFRL